MASLRELPPFPVSECRDVLLTLLIDQLSGQLDDNSSKPDHEASAQLLSNILEVLDRKDVVSLASPTQTTRTRSWGRGRGSHPGLPGLRAWPQQLRIWVPVQAVPISETIGEASSC